MKPTEVFITIMIIVAVTGYSAAHPVQSPVSVDSVKASDTLEATSSAVLATPVPTDIYSYIEYKFGDRAIDAFTVLQGKGKGTCAENRTLDPYQDNNNETWGGVGKDIGYWQINNKYHPKVTESCARDVKCSTDYAYKLFKDRGENFSAWTCGKEYGI